MDGRTCSRSVALFYEMLAGARAFRGDSTAATPGINPDQGATSYQETFRGRCRETGDSLSPERAGTEALSMADVKAAVGSEGGLELRQAIREALPTPQREEPRFAEVRAVGRGGCSGAGACRTISVVDSLREPRALPQTIVRLTTYPGLELYPVSRPTATRWRSPGTASSWKTSISTSNRWAVAARVRPHHPPGTGLLSGLVSGWPNHCLHTVSHRRPGGDSDSVHPEGRSASCSEITGSSVAWSSDSKWLAFADGESRKPLPLFR